MAFWGCKINAFYQNVNLHPIYFENIPHYKQSKSL